MSSIYSVWLTIREMLLTSDEMNCLALVTLVGFANTMRLLVSDFESLFLKTLAFLQFRVLDRFSS